MAQTSIEGLRTVLRELAGVDRWSDARRLLATRLELDRPDSQREEAR